MFPTQVLLPGWLWSGIILWDPCLVALSYLLLAGTSANIEGQVNKILIKMDLLKLRAISEKIFTKKSTHAMITF